MNLTKDIQKLTIEGEEISFRNVHISNWKSNAITGIPVCTERKVKKYYNLFWKQTALELNIFFKNQYSYKNKSLLFPSKIVWKANMNINFVKKKCI